MTEQAVWIIALGGFVALALLSGMWLRMYRRNRRARNTEPGKSTMHEINAPSRRK